ncbi:Uu.00g119510.m01.CDS01 [Anthostomella pinea]|uniref:Uu.00g119510.m01.CDS01 n=1 Tax=Anthostomella pinea TaxID=933095 RepID=A0AAI8VGN6_9PEZI|nr:Uu.00g119510.m01.CDS01 [Anthostomella pinea]
MGSEGKKRVAIVGGGISGLASLKECRAAGFEADILEARGEIGGQWAYQPISPHTKDQGPIYSSIYDGVVLNSCRDTSGFTDFPIDPARYGDYFGHRQMLQYIKEYADHFGLKEHVRLRTKVIGCVQTEDQRWRVTLQQEGKEVEEKVYDAVFAASGALIKPMVPDFKGMESFKGECFHSQSYRTPGRFEGTRVALIGLGSGAVDLSSELAPGCKEVHVVTRKGGWILPRYVLGKPTEAWDNRATQVWVPLSVSQWLQTVLLNTVQGKHPEELQPDHRIMEQNPTIRSEFLERVRTGAIQAHRAEIDSFTETGLKLSNGTHLDVDVVICCTGYHHSLPYLPTDVISSPATPPHSVDLWKMMVPLKQRSLFVMGFLELAGPAAPALEAQARLAVAALEGRVKIPESQQMEKEIRTFQAWQAKTFVRSPRHSLTDHYVRYVDSVLAPLGANPTMGRLLQQVFSSGDPWKALKTLNAVYFGITSSAQWRLCGHGKDEMLARETVLRIADGKETLSQEEVKLLSKTGTHTKTHTGTHTGTPTGAPDKLDSESSHSP